MLITERKNINDADRRSMNIIIYILYTSCVNVIVILCLGHERSQHLT